MFRVDLTVCETGCVTVCMDVDAYVSLYPFQYASAITMCRT